MPRGAIKRTELTPEQDKALNLYMRGWTPRRIADALEISPEIVNHWRREPGPFRSRLQEIVNDVEFDNSLTISQLVGKALEEVEGLLQDPSAQIRLAASKLVIETHQTMVQQREQRELMAELEERLESLQDSAQAQVLPATVEVVNERESERKPEAVEVRDSAEQSDHEEMTPCIDSREQEF